MSQVNIFLIKYNCTGVKKLTNYSYNQFTKCHRLLKLVSCRFLHMFPLELSVGDHMMISLDETVKKLGTERRRIYDIINVLESLQMASKVNLNICFCLQFEFFLISLIVQISACVIGSPVLCTTDLVVYLRD